MGLQPIARRDYYGCGDRVLVRLGGRGIQRGVVFSDTPHMLKLELNERERRLRMGGDLEGTFEDEEVLGGVFRDMSFGGRDWAIDADAMRLTPEGAALWVRLANALLGKCDLVYLPSQLSLILRYRVSYRHPRSRFLDEADLDEPKRPLSATILR